MERVEGPDLLSHIQSQPAGALPEPAARRLFAQLLCAVRHAHLRGYLHCDLKPQNVRLTADCEYAVLVDWGLARHVLRQPAIITQVRPGGCAAGRGSAALAAPFTPPALFTGRCAGIPLSPTLAFLRPSADSPSAFRVLPSMPPPSSSLAIRPTSRGVAPASALPATCGCAPPTLHACDMPPLQSLPTAAFHDGGT